MLTCTVKNCNSVENPNSDITFHKYPLFDKKLLKLWLENISSADYQPEPEDHICSLHFTNNQFLNTKPKRLIRNAVPTIFTDDTNTDRTSEHRKAKKTIDYEQSTDSNVDSDETSNTISADDDSDYELTDSGKRKKHFGTPRYVGDFKEEDLKNPEKMKRMWELAYKQISEQKTKLRTITQRNRRLEGQVTRLKNVIKHLKSVHQ